MTRSQVDNPLSRTWTNRAMWSAFLEAHAERLAASSEQQESAVTSTTAALAPRGATPVARSTRRARIGTSRRAG